MNLFIDIETIPSQLHWVRDDLRAAVKPPATYKKPDSIAEWMKENAEREAEEAWLKTSFDGGVGQIVCIGYAIDDEPVGSLCVGGTGLQSEAAMLDNFFDMLRDIHSTSGTRPVLIGHNHIAFDIPFIWKCAMVHGIKPPLWFPRNPKPWADSVVDTMLLWDSEKRSGCSMDRLCKILGIPGKDGMTGADVWPMVQAGRLDAVSAYCRDDVERTRAMWRRMEFV